MDEVFLRGKLTRSKKAPFHDTHRAIYEGSLELAPGHSVKVAIKSFKWAEDEPVRCAKISEAIKACAPTWMRLQHPNIARFYGLSEGEESADVIPAMVHAYYGHGSLPRYLREKFGGRLANTIEDSRNPVALRLVTEAARGLNYLHTLDPPFIHSDFRALNIVIDDEEHARVADAGFLQVVPSEEWAYLDPIRSAGLCRWASPELLEGLGYSEIRGTAPRPLEYTKASDVYAYGITLAEVFSGRTPFALPPNDTTSRQVNDVETLHAIMKGARPWLHPYLIGNPALRDLVIRCWDAAPEIRPSMSEVCRILEAPLPPWTDVVDDDPSSIVARHSSTNSSSNRRSLVQRILGIIGKYFSWSSRQLYWLFFRLLDILRSLRDCPG